jgi:RimJ/RimL family protein N-acetyltransferase
VLAEAFGSEGFHKVIMRIAVGNHASTRVAEKLGFTREGILREELLIRGNWVDHSLWSILDREFKTLRRGNIRSTG